MIIIFSGEIYRFGGAFDDYLGVLRAESVIFVGFNKANHTGLIGIDGVMGCGVSRWCVGSIAPKSKLSTF